ncbi:hypothetical protein [Campylobacter phage CJLB-14]|nr:hypothetical protein [Campylobacter phage CJLB-14]
MLSNNLSIILCIFSYPANAIKIDTPILLEYVKSKLSVIKKEDNAKTPEVDDVFIKSLNLVKKLVLDLAALSICKN